MKEKEFKDTSRTKKITKNAGPKHAVVSGQRSMVASRQPKRVVQIKAKSKKVK